MRRKNVDSHEEIYLISLDLFALLSALGITMGIVFIVLTLQLFGARPPADLYLITKEISTISKNDFDKLKRHLVAADSFDDLISKIENGDVEPTSGGYYRFYINKNGGRFVQAFQRNRFLSLAVESENSEPVQLEIDFYDWEKLPIRKDDSYTTDSIIWKKFTESILQ